VRTWAGSARVSQSHAAASAADTALMISSGVRQPPAACASGTAIAAAMVAPPVMPIV
jgi:mannose/fructose/N-acetylgalactosamine-specific phosphotransferase system component IIC